MFFDRPESGERAVLVHLNLSTEADREDPREFEELALSAGADPAEYVFGQRDAPHPRLFVGAGKLQEIKDQVRCEVAIDHLRNDDIKIADLAVKLGFTEPSSFVRSFRSWTGVTPKAYRDNMKAAA